MEEVRMLTEDSDPYDDKIIMKKLFHSNLKLLLIRVVHTTQRFDP